MRFPLITAILLSCLLMLGGCFESRPPKGFEAVEPIQLDTSRTGCPDLAGAYSLPALLAAFPMASQWLGTPGPEMTALIFDDVVGSNAYNFRLEMDRERFLAAVTQLRLHNPADYYDWRKLILASQQGGATGNDLETTAAIQRLGPLPYVRGQVHGRACKAGWLKVQETERQVSDEQGMFIRQWDLWLGRDADGNLLLQIDIYRQKPGWTFWAAGGAGVRLIPEHHEWRKIPSLPPQAAPMAVSEASLPPVPPPNRSPDCKRGIGDMVAYQQQLTSQLPPEVTLTRFQPIEGAPTDPCNRQALQVGFSSGPLGGNNEILHRLKADPRIDQLTVKETRYTNGQWHLGVEYQLILK